MKQLLLLLALWLLAAPAATAQSPDAPAAEVSAAVQLAEQTALDGRVTLLVPERFKLMSDEMRKTKYPSEQRPGTVFTDERGTTNVALHHTQNALAPEQIGEVHEAMNQMFESTYPSAEWNQSEVVERDGRRYFLLDLWTPALDTEIRNIMLGTSVEGRLLMVSFNTTRELETQWGTVGERIIDSVRVRE